MPVDMSWLLLSIPSIFQEAATLTESQEEQILTLAKALKESSNGGNKDRIAFSTDPTMQCNVCKARKHEVKWAELRDRGNLGGSLPRGSLCYACHRATLAFGLGTRAYEAFSAVPGALRAWTCRSKMERAKLLKYHGGTCNCTAVCNQPVTK